MKDPSELLRDDCEFYLTDDDKLIVKIDGEFFDVPVDDPYEFISEVVHS